jgi:hypothetical protein
MGVSWSVHCCQFTHFRERDVLTTRVLVVFIRFLVVLFLMDYQVRRHSTGQGIRAGRGLGCRADPCIEVVLYPVERARCVMAAVLREMSVRYRDPNPGGINTTTQ